jgi:hypothetical protein
MLYSLKFFRTVLFGVKVSRLQGEKDCLKTLLASVGEKLPQDLLDREFSVSIPATYEIIVECKDETNQKSIFEKLKSEGYKLRILTL